MKEMAAKRYFSIKWQAFSLTSLVLALIFAGFLYFVSESTFRQFEIGRSHVYEQHKQQLDSLIEASGEKLIQLSVTTLSNSDVIKGLKSHNQASLQDSIDELSWFLQVESGIDDISIYSTELQLLSIVGNAPDYSFVEIMNSTESPHWSVSCEAVCRVYGGAPILYEGEVIGFAVLSEPLSNVMLRFQHISKIDTGLLAGASLDSTPIHDRDSYERIPEWDTSLVALTNPKNSKQVITTASSQYSLDDLRQGVRLVDVNDQVFELRALPLEKNQVVVISNVSHDINTMQQSRSDSFRISVVSLVVAELFLLLLLWRPMTRIRKTASILPLLAERKYTDAKQSFTDLNQKLLFRDETDILNITALKLSSELEALQGQLETRAEQLEVKKEQLELRGEELERERDFVSQLLDTVHAIILIQDEKGGIQLSNKFAVRLSGYSARELKEKSFKSLMEDSADSQRIVDCIQDVVEGRLSEFQHEAMLTTIHGDRLHLAWRHAVLYNHDEELRQVLSVAVDISARVKAEQELAWLANHDTLSGLLNRRRFEEELDKTLADYQRNSAPFALLYLDLDDFKLINDNHGHAVGDELIQLVANVLSNNSRKTDVSARIGGDEFAMILRGIKKEYFSQVAERISTDLSSISISNNDQSITCSASIGVLAVEESVEGLDKECLIRRADEAMYHAKKAGKAAWHIVRFDQSD